jgi:hypothetical protein
MLVVQETLCDLDSQVARAFANFLSFLDHEPCTRLVPTSFVFSVWAGFVDPGHLPNSKDTGLA